MDLLKTFGDMVKATPDERTYGMIAQYETPGALLEAANVLRRAGYRRFDVHSPFPIHGMDKAMGMRRSILPFIVLGGGLTGGIGGLILQCWIHGVDYPLVISGKPFLSIPAFIPVTFELTILLSAFGAVFGMLALNMLPMLYHPLLKNDRFRSATQDGFFVSVEARDKLFHSERTRTLLSEAGGQNIELLEA